MKLFEPDTQTHTLADTLNPRGQLAKEIETTCKRATWLALVCAYWLAHHNDNVDTARHDEPNYNLPKQLPNATRFNHARKNCAAWTPIPTLRPKGEPPIHRPTWASRWYWPDVFDYWYSGAMEHDIEVLKSVLPEENVKAIESEMLK